MITTRDPEHLKGKLRQLASTIEFRIQACSDELEKIATALDSLESVIRNGGDAKELSINLLKQSNGGELPIKKKRAPRGSKRNLIIGLLMREGGCTRSELQDVTGWKSVALTQYTKAAGLTLHTDKNGDEIRYWAK